MAKVELFRAKPIPATGDRSTSHRRFIGAALALLDVEGKIPLPSMFVAVEPLFPENVGGSTPSPRAALVVAIDDVCECKKKYQPANPPKKRTISAASIYFRIVRVVCMAIV